jgi:FKBP-type peptidyl-prolyl cis-trans isomerase 2
VKIEKDKRVKLKVRLQVKDGPVIEESQVAYFHGSGTMLPGLEDELDGLEAGAKKSGVIPAAKAFGSPEQRVEKTIPRSEFPADAKLESGTQFAAKGQNGQDVVLHVLESGKDEVKVQLLHPLADKDIAYEVEVLGVTDPTPPPLPVDAVAGEDD